MTNPDERQVIRDAMDRLLAGKPIRSTGALTVVDLAREADVKRHLLTHRHTDLKDEFYARVRAQGSVPESEVALRKKITLLEGRVRDLKDTVESMESEIRFLRQMNNVLSVEKVRAEKEVRALQSGTVTAISQDPKPASQHD